MASNFQDSVKLGERGIELMVIKGDLFKEKADVLICSSTKTLDLSRGRVSKALVTAAGASIQDECRKKYPNGIEYNEIAVVGAGRMHCKNVYLVALPVWASGHKEKEVLETIMTSCLETADAQEHKSLVLPALGCGLLHYPSDLAAGIVMESVESFSNSHPLTPVRRVTVVIYHTDSAVFQAFRTKLINHNDDSDGPEQMNGAMSGEAPSNHFLSALANKPAGLGSICSARSYARKNSVEELSITVEVGDISKTEADVIVCPTTTVLNLETNSISIRILEKAGFKIQNELMERYPDGVRPGQIAVTEGFKLKCERVFHVALMDSQKEYKAKKDLCKCVCYCLDKAMEEKLDSIVFPSLGVAESNVPVDTVAKIMLKCITKHKTENLGTSLQKITVIVDRRLKNAEDIKMMFENEIEKSQTIEAEEDDEEDDMYSLNPFLVGSMHAAVKKAVERSQPRGSPEWFKTMYTTDLRPPSNWTAYRSSKTLKGWLMDADDISPKLEMVDHDTQVAVRDVVENSWISKHVGSGKDAAGLDNLNYKNIRVTKVERIENCELFEKYAQKRQEFFHKRAKRGACADVASVAGSSGPILVNKYIPDPSPLTQDIYPEINEHYLFHGTKTDKVSIILKQGLDSRLSDASAMFGSGVYMAESSTKSDQYADDKNNRSRGEKKMLLVRACLGDVIIQKTAKSFARAPCCTCDQDKCSCNSNSFYGAVVGDGSWNFREFVVYDRQQVYPEYVVTYTRV